MSLAGCVSFAPLSAELAERLAEQAQPCSPFRQRAQVEMEGYGLFEAVLVADGASSRARLQLLPEVGGKMLDLAIAPERIDGYMPPAGIALTHVRHARLAPPRHLLAFIAASVLEAITPITSERVLGERAIAGGSELHLRPALEGLEVTAQVDKEGRLLAREYRLRGVRWRERIHGEM
ncbi:MAG TPA: hypothetical protein VMT18_08055, partial [Planctomycetota bacterium]|nr:hypothetical protein [Planctomycetota bacterium]